ncbi:MAG: efflux RND transporter periplasmic adaptor subunit [Planctomycetes bacterium]|nr:efflux RND transporter periplasmic adaptor subunit [Planctomycetota bacterium]
MSVFLLEAGSSRSARAAWSQARASRRWAGAFALALLLAACSHHDAPGGAGHTHAPPSGAGATKGTSAEPDRAAAAHASEHGAVAHDHGADAHGDHDHGDAEHAGEASSHPADDHANEVVLGARALAESGIELVAAERRALAATFRAPAQVALNREGMAHVGCAVKGRVAEIRVRLGDEVAAGDVLLVVESAELAEAQSDYLSKSSAFATAGPAVELARNAHERARGLYEASQGIALTEVQRREAELHAAEAALASARTAMSAAKSRLTLLGVQDEALERLVATGVVDPRFLVRAPIRGQVVEHEVTFGELVGPERDALLVLADTSRLWVLADVPEAKLRSTAVGSRARVLLGAEQDHWCEGVVTFVSPALDPRTRSVRVRIEALDRHPELRPGVFAEAEITAPETGGEAVVVPAEAVRMVRGTTVVFVPVAGEEGAFVARPVVVGVATSSHVVIRSGLAARERVVAKQAFLLEAELGKSGAVHQH